MRRSLPFLLEGIEDEGKRAEFFPLTPIILYPYKYGDFQKHRTRSKDRLALMHEVFHVSQVQAFYPINFMLWQTLMDPFSFLKQRNYDYRRGDKVIALYRDLFDGDCLLQQLSLDFITVEERLHLVDSIMNEKNKPYLEGVRKIVSKILGEENIPDKYLRYILFYKKNLIRGMHLFFVSYINTIPFILYPEVNLMKAWEEKSGYDLAEEVLDYFYQSAPKDRDIFFRIWKEVDVNEKWRFFYDQYEREYGWMVESIPFRHFSVIWKRFNPFNHSIYSLIVPVICLDGRLGLSLYFEELKIDMVEEILNAWLQHAMFMEFAMVRSGGIFGCPLYKMTGEHTRFPCDNKFRSFENCMVTGNKPVYIDEMIEKCVFWRIAYSILGSSVGFLAGNQPERFKISTKDMILGNCRFIICEKLDLKKLFPIVKGSGKLKMVESGKIDFNSSHIVVCSLKPFKFVFFKEDLIRKLEKNGIIRLSDNMKRMIETKPWYAREARKEAYIEKSGRDFGNPLSVVRFQK